MCKIDLPTENEMVIFYNELSKANIKLAILKITHPYSEEFIPKSCLSTFPKPLTDLYNPECLQKEYHELLSECEQVFSTITVS